MAAVIQASIRPIRERLRRYVEDVRGEDFHLDGTLVGAENRRQCTVLEDIIINNLERVVQSVEELENQNRIWMNWLGTLNEAQYQREANIFTTFSEGEEGHVQLIEIARKY